MIRHFFKDIGIACFVIIVIEDVSAKEGSRSFVKSFGILTSEEIAEENKILAEPANDGIVDSPRWTCFETKNIRFRYNNLGYDSDAKRTMADAEIEVIEDGC